MKRKEPERVCGIHFSLIVENFNSLNNFKAKLTLGIVVLIISEQQSWLKQSEQQKQLKGKR